MLKVNVSSCKVGDKIHINFCFGHPEMDGVEGVIKYISPFGEICGTWGNVKLDSDRDDFEVIR